MRKVLNDHLSEWQLSPVNNTFNIQSSYCPLRAQVAIGKAIKVLKYYLFIDKFIFRHLYLCLYILLTEWAESSKDAKWIKKYPSWWLPSPGEHSLLRHCSLTDLRCWHGAAMLPASPQVKPQRCMLCLSPLGKRHQGRNTDFLAGTEAPFWNVQRKCQVWVCQVPDFRVHSDTSYKFLWCVFGTTCYPRLIICSQIAESVWKSFLL